MPSAYGYPPRKLWWLRSADKHLWFTTSVLAVLGALTYIYIYIYIGPWLGVCALGCAGWLSGVSAFAVRYRLSRKSDINNDCSTYLTLKWASGVDYSHRWPLSVQNNVSWMLLVEGFPRSVSVWTTWNSVLWLWPGGNIKGEWECRNEN